MLPDSPPVSDDHSSRVQRRLPSASHWAKLLGPLSVFAVVATLAACADTPALTGASPRSILSSRVGGPTPLCVEGCLDPDPDPSAPGYFFPGLENQFAHCADGDHDQDQDGLDDECEYLLAHAFRPEMSSGLGDDVRGEPRWAAEWLDSDPGSAVVRIAYLPSYWIDLGDGGASESACESFTVTWLDELWDFFFGWFLGSAPSLEDCGGHLGDSEFIRLDISYDFDTQHWYVSDARYSAHLDHVDFTLRPSDSKLYVSTTTTGGGSNSSRNFMEYPDGKVGGYPRSYVADRKHANYPTAKYCNVVGGTVGSDQCANPRQTVRFDVALSQNLGSRAHQFINCVTTQRTDHPLYGSNFTECYWSSTQRFKGWFNPASGGGTATPYGIVLGTNFAF